MYMNHLGKQRKPTKCCWMSNTKLVVWFPFGTQGRVACGFSSSLEHSLRAYKELDFEKHAAVSLDRPTHVCQGLKGLMALFGVRVSARVVRWSWST